MNGFFYLMNGRFDAIKLSSEKCVGACLSVYFIKIYATKTEMFHYFTYELNKYSCKIEEKLIISCAGGRSVILLKAKPSGCTFEEAPSGDEETPQNAFTSAG